MKLKRFCSVEGCGKPHKSKGYCGVHYDVALRFGDPKHETKSVKKWTDDDRARVAVMLRDKATSAKIAEAFGVDKNCIIGLVHRDKTLRAIGFNWRIAHPHRPVGERPKRVKRPPGQPRIKLSKIPGVLSLMPQKQSLFNFKPVPLPKPIPTVFECRSVPMLELRARECKWPVNDAAIGETHLFCGNPAEGSYCPIHARLSVGYGTRSEQLATRPNRPGFFSHMERAA